VNRFQEWSSDRAFPSALSFFAAFTTLAKIFVATMLVQTQRLDWGYLLFALPRISLIALGAGLLAWALAPLLQRTLIALLFGAVTGFAGACLYVAAAA
jgi:hypothetical protein